MNVTTETATVYRAGDRRYLTKRGAYIHAATLALKVEYDCALKCDPGDPTIGPGPVACGFHGGDMASLIRAKVAELRGADA